jgi:Isoprenylcysteine carboxyl methyltransferase (ICMT) family
VLSAGLKGLLSIRKRSEHLNIGFDREQRGECALQHALILRQHHAYLLRQRVSASPTTREADCAEDSLATRAGQSLQRSGLYGLVRHPSYLGLELILLAFALYARTWVCFAVVLVPPTLAVLYRIHIEETALRLAYGADYEGYSRSTKRLIPGVY